MEKARGLKVLDLKMPDFLRSIEHAVQLGTPVLMQDVLEEMDPSLDPATPLLARTFGKSLGREGWGGVKMTVLCFSLFFFQILSVFFAVFFLWHVIFFIVVSFQTPTS